MSTGFLSVNDTNGILLSVTWERDSIQRFPNDDNLSFKFSFYLSKSLPSMAKITELLNTNIKNDLKKRISCVKNVFCITRSKS